MNARTTWEWLTKPKSIHHTRSLPACNYPLFPHCSIFTLRLPQQHKHTQCPTTSPTSTTTRPSAKHKENLQQQQQQHESWQMTTPGLQPFVMRGAQRASSSTPNLVSARPTNLCRLTISIHFGQKSCIFYNFCDALLLRLHRIASWKRGLSNSKGSFRFLPQLM